MGESAALQQIARSLKAIESHQAKQTRILETLNLNLVELFKKPSVTVEPAPTRTKFMGPSIYGWVIANQMQALGQLEKGDRKVDEDQTHWVWVGDSWERVELPNG